MKTKPCATCEFWNPSNRTMGHCVYPLPSSIKELVGPRVMNRGNWMWIEQVLECSTYLKSPDVLEAREA